MPTDDEFQPLSADDLEALEREIKRHELLKLVEDKNIAIKQDTGYFEAVARNAAIDSYRKGDPGGYKHSRRQKAEKVAAAEGRTLRAYKRATPERRREQQRKSKQTQREDPAFAEAERQLSAARQRAKRALMSEAEREAAKRKRREDYAEKKAKKLAEALAINAEKTVF